LPVTGRRAFVGRGEDKDRRTGNFLFKKQTGKGKRYKLWRPIPGKGPM
jgi:hypothetical protein